MFNGISVYAGLDSSVEENLTLIERAAELGFKRIFTSSQIPEAMEDIETFYEEFSLILAAAAKFDFEVIIDVNADNIDAFDFTDFTFRLDDGFDIEQIAAVSQVSKIQLNASTVNEEFLTALFSVGANFANISALHNFYPRPDTGLDTYYFTNQNKLLHDFGINVGAFAASRYGRRRLPICQGLTTIETCRNFTTDLTARYLAALGTDFIIIGDGLPTDEELTAVAAVTDNEVIMKAQLITDDPVSIQLLSNTFTARAEVSRSVIRAADSRRYLSQLGGIILPDERPVDRTFGDVTIDNVNYGRYMGEVQIIEDLLPADQKVNVVAKIPDEEKGLASCIKPRQKFSFRFTD